MQEDEEIRLDCGVVARVVHRATGRSGAGDRGWLKGVPLNHVGIQVEDLDAVEERVVAAGLVPFSHGDYEPGRRFYFMDWDGIEFEIVSYA